MTYILKIINTAAYIWHDNILDILPWTLHVSLPQSSHFSLSCTLRQSTVCLSEQIMPADKYRSIFSHQMVAVVYIAAQINKLTGVSFSCICPVNDHEFRYNIVKVAS